MESGNQESCVPETLFEKWNKALLWLLALETGYLIVVISVGAGVVIGALAGAISRDDFDRIYQVAQFAPYPLALAVPLNMVGSLGTLILVLRGKHQSRTVSDWLGHVLNWTYVIGTGWIYLAWVLTAITFRMD